MEVLADEVADGQATARSFAYAPEIDGKATSAMRTACVRETAAGCWSKRPGTMTSGAVD
jgi:hypothetical protein